MTTPAQDLAAILAARFARIQQRTTSVVIRAECAAGLLDVGTIPHLAPVISIVERRQPNSERRRKDVPVGLLHRAAGRRGRHANNPFPIVPPVARVDITTADFINIIVSGTFTPAADLYDAADQLLFGRAIIWSGNNNAIATVNPITGAVTGVTPGSITVTASAEGILGTFGATISTPQNAVATVTIPATATVTVGSQILVGAVVRDSFGNQLTGKTVTWAEVPASAATSLGADSATEAHQVPVTGSAAGTTNLVATCDSISSSPCVVTVSLPAADHISITTQPTAAPVNGIAFAQQPVVQLRAADNSALALAGVTVTAGIGTGAGALGGTLTAVTDASGVATFTNLKLTGLVGARTLVFTASGVTGVTSSTVTLAAGAAAIIAARSSQNQSATVATNVGAPPSVLVTDSGGNPKSGVSVAFAVTGGGGSVSPASVSSDVNGIATLTSWTVGSAPGTNTVTATAAGLTGSPVSFNTNALAATPDHVSITTQPSAAPVNGSPFAQQPAIQLRDPSNNAVAQAGVVVTASISSGAGTLGGTLTATTDINGLATFANLSITGAVGARTLQFSAPGLISAASSTVTLVAGSASVISINSAASQSAQINSNVSAPPSVKVTDASGNPKSGIVVSFSVTGGGGSCSPATVTTDVNGIATLTSWTFGAAVGTNNNTLSASA